LFGPFAPSLAGSELTKLRGELGPGLPGVEIGDQAAALAFIRESARSGELSAIHDVSDGGLAAALAEMAIAAGVGLEADANGLVELRGCSGETALFGEGPGGFVIAGSTDAVRSLLARAADGGLDAIALGTVSGDRIELAAAEAEASVLLADAERAWRSLGERFA